MKCLNFYACISSLVYDVCSLTFRLYLKFFPAKRFILRGLYWDLRVTIPVVLQIKH